ncbi:MAG: fibronectin type III domain-containing protein [Candidatus Pacebacteria bacterium]|nr:fibronectin type III domain-containing protein [Candidatus Paceibacterota bacterium]
MKKRIIKILALTIIFQLLAINFAIAQSSQNDVKISLQVGTTTPSVCLEDDICDTAGGETEANCPHDCGCNNNGSCESARGENNSNCPNDCYVAPPVIPVSPGAVIPFTSFRIINVYVGQVTDQSAHVSWVIESQAQAICKVFLGLTENYEQETIASNVFSKFHATQITGLLPFTTYHFKIYCQSINFAEAQTKDFQFTTLPSLDNEPPSNVSDFQAINQDKQLKLTWQNPSDNDFKEVRIFRSEKFYPREPQDGTLVYVGNSNEVEDLNLVNGKSYYYTAFAYDLAGNQSSGALTFGVPGIAEIPSKPPIEEPIGPVPPEVAKISLKDFDFQQGGKRIFPTDDNSLILNSNEPVKISIDYEKVPEVLKTIMLTLQKGDKYFSFLLKIDKDKTKYLATIAPPEPGIYPLSIYILDYKEQALKKIDSMLEIQGQGDVMGQEKIFDLIVGIIIRYWPNILFLIILIIAIITAVEIYKKKRQSENYYEHIKSYKNWKT